MEFSSFGTRLTRETGARRLMDDLGGALAGGGPVLMLGGGNPAHIPEVQSLLRERMRAILDEGDNFARMVGNYDSPQGEGAFLEALAGLLRRTYGWDVGPGNVALTAGSQSGFFILFNLLAGDFDDGRHKRILLPVTPEYIGYADLGLSGDFFVARRPSIEHLSDRMFKYHLELDDLDVGPDVGAICVSRPTNPTGNVLTDAEIDKLRGTAAAHAVPLILDDAYGAPFPYMIFSEVTPVWDENVILCMSLSKLGLPGVRTGIIVAAEPVIDAVTSVNAVLNLATGSVGAALTLELVRSGEIIDLSRRLIRPFYHERAMQAVQWAHEVFQGTDYHVHTPEGALFLWLWFRDLPITSAELYRRLKARGVLVLSGHYFFPGLHEPWQHMHECIRVNYAQPPEIVREGLRIMGEEVARAYAAEGTRRARPAAG